MITVNLYSIGQASEMIGVPVPAIRYYESIGLCEPSFIDQNSGYRYYSIDDIFKLDLIRSLGRQMGMPLKEIRSFIREAGDQETMLRYLTNQSSAIDREIQSLNSRKAMIEEKIAAIRQRREIPVMEPYLKHLEEIPLSVKSVSASSLEDAILQARAAAAPYQFQDIQTLYLIISDYREPLSHFESLPLRVGLPLMVVDEGFSELVLPAGNYAEISYPNRDDVRVQAHELLRGFIMETGLKPDGPVISSGSLIDTTTASSRDYLISTRIKAV